MTSLKIERDTRFLYAEDFYVDGQWHEYTLTIKKVHGRDTIKAKDGKLVDRYAVEFEQTEKLLVLNATNTGLIKAMYGGDAATWPGKKVALFPVLVDAFGERDVPALRVRVSPGTPIPMRLRKHLGKEDLTRRGKE